MVNVPDENERSEFAEPQHASVALHEAQGYATVYGRIRYRVRTTVCCPSLTIPRA